MYNKKYSFSEYKNFEKYMNYLFKTKCNRFTSFYHHLNEFKKFTCQIVKTKMKKKILYNNALNLYIELLSIYFNDYNNITT